VTIRVFVDLNDRDQAGDIRIGKLPIITDGQGTPVAPQPNMRVEAYDNSMRVPGILQLDGESWIIKAHWSEAHHED
jgi:hypothetical protein